jgi:hypothetical protein
MALSHRYISTSHVSQADLSANVGVLEGDGGGGPSGSDILSGSHPIKVLAYQADAPLPTSWMSTNGKTSSNYTVELQIGEREKIGQGTFGYWTVVSSVRRTSLIRCASPGHSSRLLGKCTKRN